ncbi:MAG: tyrosine-type recombinase/integrase [Acidobacteria bacterium]|nr:tyrosine-type recombinase/integrase [Acidobacteriota bacterium]
MVLEDLLRRSWELTRYRRPPLGLEVDGFCQWLHEQGYSRSVMRSHIAKVSQFNWYLRCLGIKDCGEVQELHAGGFIGQHLRKRGRVCSRHTAPAVRCLMKYLSTRGVLTCTAETPPYEGVLNAYAEDLRHHRALADSTIKIYRHYLIPFLQSLDGKDILKSLSEVSPRQIHGFFAEHAQGKADTTRGQIHATLRTFFAFCARQGYVAGHLAETVPKVFRHRLANVPRQISEHNAQKLLESIDRSTPAGRRDYAIVLLLHTYGVRGAQIRSLRLEDIQWRQSRIRFRSCKGGKEIVDPLTDQVGESLLDYLRFGRPKTAYCEVFLTAHAPFHPLNADNLYSMIAARMRRVGVTGTALGPHALRHAFATCMLNSGQLLKAIADMLGHRDVNSTFIYTKVDFETLEQLPLDWPEV